MAQSHSLRVVLLKSCRALGLFAVARYLTRRRLRILCYHGFSIGDQHEYDPILFMRKETFRERMQALHSQGYPVVSLSDGIELLKRNAVDSCQVCITIDDGWKSTFVHARPVLQEYSLPACIYVTTYYTDRQAPVFNVVIWYMLWRTKRLQVCLCGIHPEVDGDYDLTMDRRTVGQQWISTIERHFDYRARQSILPIIAEALDLDAVRVLEGERFQLMDTEQLQTLSRDPNIELQLHTHRHRFPTDSEELARREVEDNRRVLEALTGKPCLHFCYPSGLYHEKHPSWLATMGIESATTCDSGTNGVDVSPLLLRRYLDRDDWSAVEFEAAVSGFLDVVQRLRPRRIGKEFRKSSA